jgi:hypothetical protein
MSAADASKIYQCSKTSDCKVGTLNKGCGNNRICMNSTYASKHIKVDTPGGTVGTCDVVKHTLCACQGSSCIEDPKEAKKKQAASGGGISKRDKEKEEV